jgi:hypothetical protein
VFELRDDRWTLVDTQVGAVVRNPYVPSEKQPSTAELSTLYDPSSLVEKKTLRDFPLDLQSVLGVHSTDSPRIADVGEPCDPTDVVRIGYPDRCFLIGGLGGTSALVAYKVGGYEGQWEVAARYVHAKSGWVKIGEGRIGYPNSLSELKEMSRLAAENNPSKQN